ncbi:MAG TPA: hypothetical protein VEB43_13910 [Anaeromyxobacter sp.]|nr:hypothetical protein [Anaeromyxobacter sp.]
MTLGRSGLGVWGAELLPARRKDQSRLASLSAGEQGRDRPLPSALERLALRFVLALLLSLAGPAAAATPAARPLPRLGLVVDAGLPGGAGLLAQARLAERLRLQAGPFWSGVGFGVKGGAVIAPFRGAVAPVVELEAGYGFRADLSFLAGRGDVPEELAPVLARARYAYAAAYLGVDVGSPRGLSFFVRAGLARLVATAPGAARTDAGAGTLLLGDATLDATVPSAKLGLQLWF